MKLLWMLAFCVPLYAPPPLKRVPTAYLVVLREDRKCTHCGGKARFIVNFNSKKRYTCMDHVDQWNKMILENGREQK